MASPKWAAASARRFAARPGSPTPAALPPAPWHCCGRSSKPRCCRRIAEFDEEPPAWTKDAFRIYGLTLAHKHLPEIAAHAGLAHPPVFAPSVGRFAQGMIVQVPLALWALPGSPRPADLRDALAAAYEGERFVTVTKSETAALQQQGAGASGYVAALDPESLNGTNRMRLFVFGSADRRQALLVALLDNLGKGASGAAVQNLNLMLGLDEAAGL